MSERESYPKAEFFRIFTECSEVRIEYTTWYSWTDEKWHLFHFCESRICPNTNIYRMFRFVDWTQDMIIVKWPSLIWHERKLCALTNVPPVQSTETGQWLSTIFHANFHANCSVAQVYVLHPRQFIFAQSCRRLSFLQVLQSTER